MHYALVWSLAFAIRETSTGRSLVQDRKTMQAIAHWYVLEHHCCRALLGELYITGPQSACVACGSETDGWRFCSLLLPNQCD